ncbi:MAG: NAD(P)H-dependent oxidoreductase subunit E [Clostridia bacterium]|nr:NAD(P)H-dependent oxidoreductase subunit E [Clostridia bacterium]
MKVTVCIGSSCHIKGSRLVVEQLQNLISENHLENTVELAGTFCLGQCQKGVCVTIGDDFFSVTPENVVEFFNENVLAKA